MHIMIKNLRFKKSVILDAMIKLIVKLGKSEKLVK